MTGTGKLVLGILALGGIGFFVFAAGEKKASASPGGGPPDVKPPVLPPVPGTLPIPPSGGIIIAPPAGFPLPGVPPVVAPPSGEIPIPGGGSVNPGQGTATLPGGVQVQLPPGIPNPLGNGGGVTLPAPPTSNVPGQITLPPIVITPGTLPLPSGAPPNSPAEQPTTAPDDTIATVTAMLAQEHSPHWRVIPEPTLKQWQAKRGLAADGDFGTGTALRMAQEIGTLPIIRGWPRGSSLHDGHLDNYRASLVQIANSAPEPRRSQLMAATTREQGQGFGTPEKPIATLIQLQEP